MIDCPQFIQRKNRLGLTLIRTRLRQNLVNVSGFTLIELLVVISIIGILSTILLANFMGTRERARDAQRKAAVNQVQKALELYKNSQSSTTYPASTWSAMAAALEDTAGGGVKVFMKNVPNDPLYNAGCTSNCYPNYDYVRDPGASGDNLTYRMIVCFENASDPQRDATKNSYCASQGASYTVTEP